MSRTPLKSLLLGTVVLATLSDCVPRSSADDKPADKYNETGSVVSAISKHGHFYQIATDSKVYLLLCTKVKGLQFGEPECKLNDKPIATGDTVHFRLDTDFAYMPPISGESMEEKLRILATELKVTPPLPPAPAYATPATGNAPNVTTEGAVVIGTGTHIKGQKGAFWSTTPATGQPVIAGAGPSTPVMASAPVTAIPVTGGAPVLVTPVAPTTGGVVTGIPVTGGPPITAIPTAPVTGVPVGGGPAPGGVVMAGSAPPQWVHILRIQTAGGIYQLECSSKPCSLLTKEIALGDALTLRTDKKHAYLSSTASGGAEQEYKILNVDLPASTADFKPH